jgi:hypothetical protein
MAEPGSLVADGAYAVTVNTRRRRGCRLLAAVADDRQGFLTAAAVQRGAAMRAWG